MGSTHYVAQTGVRTAPVHKMGVAQLVDPSEPLKHLGVEKSDGQRIVADIAVDLVTVGNCLHCLASSPMKEPSEV